MTRILLSLLWMSIALPAFAACSGRNLMDTLTPEERETLANTVAEVPYADGNHWIATREDQVLHLVGTVHLSDPRLDGPVARLTPVVEGADTLLLEMTKAEMAVLQSEMATNPTLLLLPDQSLPELLPEEEWQRLSEAVNARGLPPFMGARMRPWYVSMILSVPPCMAGQLAEQNGMDAQLEKVAEAAGVETRALEPYDTAFGLFSEMPMEAQLAMIRSALAAPEINEDIFETLLTAYFDEYHAAGQAVLDLLTPRLTGMPMEEYEHLFVAFNEALVSERNHAWIPVILDTMDAAEGPVVAAFGAAHLSGEDGVLRLLEAEGFTLEKATF